MQTVNNGMLCTTGRGTCIAELILGGEKYQITLHKCLHASGALINLLLVGHMLGKGWDCEFKRSCGSSTSHCQLSYNGEVLGSLPLVGNICHVDLQFIHPSKLVPYTPSMKEISAVAKPMACMDGSPRWWLSQALTIDRNGGEHWPFHSTLAVWGMYHGQAPTEAILPFQVSSSRAHIGLDPFWSLWTFFHPHPTCKTLFCCVPGWPHPPP